MMADDFSGRSALITGAASGIGLACAHHLASRGIARLILTDIDSAGLAAARQALGSSVVTLVGSVADPDFWAEAEPNLVDLDFALANAGVAGNGDLHTHDYAEWRRIMSVNLDGVFLTLRAAMAAMKVNARGGAIVVTSSASGLKAEPGIAAYGASKAAVLHLARIAAKEGASYGVRVNAIAPAGVETPIWRGVPFFDDLVKKTGSEEAAFADIAANSPMGRFARPEEIAAQITFLLSGAAATITGVTLTSDGGYTL
jgi:NAD(P)-dependent dehydrogenase (short-subunit alcohol dehydrogenase family)